MSLKTDSISNLERSKRIEAMRALDGMGTSACFNQALETYDYDSLISTSKEGLLLAEVEKRRAEAHGLLFRSGAALY